MANSEFKAESKRLLDLMINSVYTHREIFLRELISNASDALDKLYYRSLTDGGIKADNLEITLLPDKKTRTLTISDGGCGMTKKELEENLGTIAKSGTLAFKNELGDKSDALEIIGQFGVGFYSAFMVSKKISVLSRAAGSDEAWEWVSSGVDGYAVNPAAKEFPGTTIVLYLKDDTDDESYSEYLEEYTLKSLVRRYSDYIRHPIKMPVEKRRAVEGQDKYETYTEIETLNSMVPLWKRPKSEITEAEYNDFYKSKFSDFEDPFRVIHTSAEGGAIYSALVFIPSHAPFDYFSKDFEKGLALYSSGVLIMEKCADLLPDCFGFVRGLVDTPSLSLNISRELLQHDRQLKTIASHLEKKIKNELITFKEKDREKYEKFWKSFGITLKYGVYSGFGAGKELLKDLLLFHSSATGKLASLSEYVSRMKEGQKNIYYACGSSAEQIDSLPQTEFFKDKGFEILYLTDDIDEFALKMMRDYDEKPFKSVSDTDADITEKEKKSAEEKKIENKDLFAFIKEALSGKVEDVLPSSRLKSHAVCLAAEGEISLEMEKVLNAMPSGERVKAKRVLEINTGHAVFPVLKRLFENDRERLKSYSLLLYSQALLAEGLLPEDIAGFSAALLGLMTKSDE